MQRLSRICISQLVLVLGGCIGNGYASLIPFQDFVGNVAVSTGGLGTTSNGGAITVHAPSGSTVLGAFMYTTFNSGPAGVSGTLNGTPVAYGAPVVNASSPGLGEERADVTSIVAPVINAGAGGAYSFNFTEGSTLDQDGTVLVVVYSNAALPVSTVGILDGAQSSTGDSFFANFATPLDPTAPGFSAEMRLGIGFSFNPGDPATQFSDVSVNSTLISSRAGNFDDGAGANGALLTIGDESDPFTPFLPASINDDHERYNLVPFIKAGDTSIRVDTLNPSNDDNIFLAVLDITGRGVITSATPEPATWTLIGSGLIALGYLRKRRF